MNILYLEWNSFLGEDIVEILSDVGHCVKKVSFTDKKVKRDKLESILWQEIQNLEYELLFSFNYFPEVSNACKNMNLKYVSWVYDSPHINVYSYTVINPCNYIFLFDYALYRFAGKWDFNGILSASWH